MRAITVEEICKKLKPILGKKIDQLYLKYALSDNREDKEQIQRLLNLLYEKHLNTTLLDEKIIWFKRSRLAKTCMHNRNEWFWKNNICIPDSRKLHNAQKTIYGF
jgi:hypothetical protein